MEFIENEYYDEVFKDLNLQGETLSSKEFDNCIFENCIFNETILEYCKFTHNLFLLIFQFKL